jgi:hypothetical protein
MAFMLNDRRDCGPLPATPPRANVCGVTVHMSMIANFWVNAIVISTVGA